MENVRQIAMFCVGRAVFFGAFAISIIMLSFAFNGVLLFRSGGILTLAMSVILLWYAQTAHKRHPRVTETWIYIAKDERPRNEHAIKAFREIMKETYGFYAYYSVIVGSGFFALSLLMQVTGLNFNVMGP